MLLVFSNIFNAISRVRMAHHVLFDVGFVMSFDDFPILFMTGQKLSGVAGSPAYVAPEVLLGDYSEKVDIWAAGVLLHLLLVGELPFNGGSLEAVFEAIKKTELDFTCGVWESISELARDLLSRMLTRDVSKRITTDEILSELKISPLFVCSCF